MNRRGFLMGAGALGLAALAGCASPRTSRPGKLTLWYWTRGLSENVLKEALQRFDGFDPANVGHDLRPKLLAVMSGDAYIPDMSMVNDDIAGYFADADHFVDMNPLGADKVRDQYLDWKWQAGSTPDGKLLGFPLDTGPSALYYRYDLFQQAGFPHEPADVEKAVATWDDYFRFGQELMKALPGRYMITDAKRVFTYSMAQEPRKYLDRQGNFIGDQDHVRKAWQRAVTAVRMKLTAGFFDNGADSGSVDQHAAWSAGTEMSVVNASWMTSEIKDAAPKTSGAWRVCRSPGGAGNQGGSFITITSACPKPQEAFEIISWLLNPANQARNYVDAGLFPSAPAAFTDPRASAPDPFFGGQNTAEVFGRSASEVQPAYFSAYDITVSNTITDELVNVESAGKDPDRAWQDAQKSVRQYLQRRGAL